MFVVYDKMTDPKGNQTWLTRGTFATWRETHAVRRLQKYQRVTQEKTAITSVVYDERGNFLCTP
jgi:hypothetical protein